MSDDSLLRRRISRRDVLRIGAAGALAIGSNSVLGGLGAEEQPPGKPKRPLNVLFINTDQQRHDALSCAGSTCVKTPNLDRLASQGVRFAHAHSPSAMCVPTRCAWATGLSIHTTGCISRASGQDFAFGAGTFDQHLAKLGYHVEYHGRYHAPEVLTDCYANQVDLGFTKPYTDYLQQTLGDPPPCADGELDSKWTGWPYKPDPMDFRRAKSLPGLSHNRQGLHVGVHSLPGPYSYSAYVADQTIDALKRVKDKPFAITAAFLPPHLPWYVPREWAGSVDPKKMPVPPTLDDDRSNTPYAKSNWHLVKVCRENLGLFQARYYEMVQETDHHIGRVLRALDELGIADNTLVIFTADHGEMLGCHGLTQKFVAYQESIRVPLIVRLPGRIPANKRIDHPASTIDIFATIFDYAALDCPKQHGTSLRRLIEQTGAYPEYVFTEFGREGYVAFTSSDWKYVWTVDPESVDLLFDVQNDPQEMNNLLGKNPDRARHLPKARRVRRAMLDWMEHINHPYKDKLAASEIG